MSVSAALRASIAAFVLTVVAVFAVPTAASAHDAPLTFTPVPGSTVTTSPTEVAVDFSAEVSTMGAEVSVVDANQVEWTSGAAIVDGARLSAALQPDMPAGEYRVTWRVAYADSHPGGGSFVFSVDVPAAAEPAPTEIASPVPTSNPAASAEAPQATAPAVAATPTTAEPTAPLPWLVGGVIVAAFIAVMAVVIARNRRS